MNHEQSFTKRKASMVLNFSPYYATLLLKMKVVWTDKIPTAGVDGKTLMINIEFWNSLTDPEQMFLLLHETMHVAFLHVIRGSGLNKQVFNLAADFVINLFIEDSFSAQQVSMPKGGLLDEKYRDMSTEQVYKLLMDEFTEEELEAMAQAGNSHDIIQGKAADVAEVKMNVTQAARSDRSVGLPDEVTAIYADIVQPQVNWSVVLNRYLTNTITDDTSYQTINRRRVSSGLYLPGNNSVGAAGTIVVYIDSSGSVSREDFSQLFSEMKAIYHSVQPEKILFKTFDTSIRNEYEFIQDGRFNTPDLEGGGGTDIQCVVDDLNKNPRTDIAIIMSDFFSPSFSTPSTQTNYIALVINNPNYKCPFGHSIYL